MKPLIALGIAFILFSACGDRDTTVNVNNQSPTGPSSVITTKIEFRVTGNALSARIKYSNQIDGLNQTISTLPFFTSFNTNESSMFLSLEETPVSYPFSVLFPFMSIQIIVNGELFREATSTDFLLNTLSVNGTWRR